MPVRDLSPSAWVSPGTARLSLDLILTNMNQEPLDLDAFLSVYSPGSKTTVNWTTGNNVVTVPDTTNDRFLLVVLPFGNVQTVVVKGATVGDAGFNMNPNGFFLTTLDPNHMPAEFNFLAGNDIAGVTILTF